MAQVRQDSHGQPAEEVKFELSYEGPGVHSCTSRRKGIRGSEKSRYQDSRQTQHLRNRRKSGARIEWRVGRKESGQKDSEGFECSVGVFGSRSHGISHN